MRTLEECKAAWIEERERLTVALNRNLAAPFLGYAPAGFSSAEKRVLYVGKATENDFLPESKAITVQGQEEHARNIFKRNIATKNEATFWGFARRVLEEIETKSVSKTYLAWSNICRVGELSGSPKKDLLKRQHPLALETLKAEISFLKPTLILLVCHHDCDQMLQELCEDPTYSTWKPENKTTSEDVWWRYGASGLPPMVWMRHPQMSQAHLRELALKKVVELA